MHVPPSSARRSGAAFTLVELLVSLTIIALIMVMVLGIVNGAQQVWQRTTVKAAQFQSARAGFEALTRRLSQATLNTYLRAYDPSRKVAALANYEFRRQSELQFLSGPAATILTAPSIGKLNPNPALSYPTHAVFFEAPIGYTEFQGSANGKLYEGADTLLSGCGYFVEYGQDPTVPAMITKAGVPQRSRFRLMELTMPGERLAADIYFRTDASPGLIDPLTLDARKTNSYTGLVDMTGKILGGFVRPFWLSDSATDPIGALGRETADNGVSYFTYGRTLAENVIALVILPKYAAKDQVNAEDIGSLSPRYAYDSWRSLQSKSTGYTSREHLLPPIVQVTMVAIDENSAQRVAKGTTTPPKWTDGLFQRVVQRADYEADLKTLEDRLIADPNKISYRVFTTDIVLRGSKWSQLPN